MCTIEKKYGRIYFGYYENGKKRYVECQSIDKAIGLAVSFHRMPYMMKSCLRNTILVS